MMNFRKYKLDAMKGKEKQEKIMKAGGRRECYVSIFLLFILLRRKHKFCASNSVTDGEAGSCDT
jgi:hypothetical protein